MNELISDYFGQLFTFMIKLDERTQKKTAVPFTNQVESK